MRLMRLILGGACALLLSLTALSVAPAAEGDDEPDWAAVEAEIAAQPGDVAHALPRLHRLLEAPGEYRDRALRRLVALARVGAIPPTEARLIDALEDARHRHKEDRRLFESSLAIAALRELRGDNLRTDLMALGLAYLAGDRHAVARALRPLRMTLDDFHVDDTTAGHLRWFAREKHLQNLIDRVQAGGGVAAADPAAAVADFDPAGLSEAFAAAAERGLPASEDLGAATHPWWLLRQGVATLEPDQLGAPGTTAGRTPSTEGAILATWRRRPFAGDSQRAMLELAGEHLVAGRRTLAAACFADVAATAADPALRIQARSGRWLCWAGDPARRGELAVALAALVAPVPWAGAQRSGDELRAELLASDPDQATTGDGFAHVELDAPIAAGWSPALFDDYWQPAEFSDLLAPGVSFQEVDGLLLVAAPRLLACYDAADPGRPLWSQVANGEWDARQLDTSDRSMATLGGFRPSVSGGTIYTRWGPATVDYDRYHPREQLRHRGNLRSMRQTPNHIAAFDLRDGRMRWSTAGRVAELDERLPVCDPVVDGDRIYVFCKDLERQSYRFSLLCLDATDGSLRWTREVGHGGEFRGDEVGKRVRNSIIWNTAMFGAAPALRDGVAYWATSGGFVTAIDLRDGLVLWRHDYAIDEPEVAARGATPAIVGDTLVVIAKDLRGALGLELATGQQRWANRLAPAHELVTTEGDLVVLRGGERLIALGAHDGAVRWHWSAEGPLLGGVQRHAQRHAQRLLAMVGERLIALDLASGVVIAQDPAPGGTPQTSWAVHGGRLLAIAPVADGGAIGDRLRRSTPRIHAEDGRGLVVSDAALELVDWSNGGRVVWRRYKPVDLLDARLVDDRVLLLTARGVTALDAAKGRPVWQRELDPVDSWQVMAGYALVGQDPKGDGHYDLLRIADGERVRRVPRPYSDHWREHTRVRQSALIDDAIHLLVYTVRRRDDQTWLEHIVVPLAGGEPTTERVWETKGQHWVRAQSLAGNRYWWVTNSRFVHSYDLASGAHQQHERMPGDHRVERYGSYDLTAFGDRCLVALPQVRHSNLKHDVRRLYRAGEKKPLYELTEGDQQLELVDDQMWLRRRGQLLRVGDDGKEQAVLELPPSDAGHTYTPVEWRRRGEEWLLVSRRNRLQYEHRGSMRDVDIGPNDVDHFALERYAGDGAFRARLDLPTVRPHRWDLVSNSDNHRPRVGHSSWRNEIVWGEDALWISAEDGVHHVALAELPAEGTDGGVTHLLYRLDGRLAVDGRIDDWDRVTHVEQTQGDARLLISHDRSHLLIAAVLPGAAPEPLHGEGRFGGDGTWLELDLRGNRWPVGGRSWQFDLAIGSSGEVALRRVVPPGIQAVARYDHARQAMVYELAVPVDPLRDSDVRLADEVLFEATAYDRGHRQVAWPAQSLRLHQYTTEQEAAGLTLAAAMPRLHETQHFLREILDIHIGSWPDGRDFVRRLLADHADQAIAGLALAHADELIHRSGDKRDPDPRLIALAEESGVSTEQIQGYRKLFAGKRGRARDWGEDWPGVVELAPEAAQRLLEQQVLALGRAPAAVSFLSALRRVRELDHDEGIALIRWFLERFPDHPEADDLLQDWLQLARASSDNQEAAVAKMDAGLDEMSSLPWRLVYDFRREKTHRGEDHLTHWHVVGPFPVAGLLDYDYGVPLPPRLRQITLKERYRMPQRTLSWQPLTSPAKRVPISHWLGNPLEPSIAYGVAWVKSPVRRQAAIELDADGPCRVWVNRQYVHRSEPGAKAEPFHVWLAAGWNAILVEQAMASNGGWTFELQLVERSGKGVLDDLEVLEVDGYKSITEPSPVDPATLQPGLRCEVYHGQWREMPDFDQLEPEDVIVTQDLDLSVTERRDHLGLRFTGYVKIEELGFYTFSTASDDGSFLLIGDQVVVNNGGLHGTQERFGTATLKPGYYPITVTMFENEGGEHLEVFWRRHGEDEKQHLTGDAIWTPR